MLRQQDPTTARILGETLAELLRTEDCLLVASTDLSHFYDQSAARQLDSAMLTAAESFEPDALFEIERSGKGEACGLGALAATLWAAKALGADAVKILNYATSGDASGDYERVVGYGAGVITLSAKPEGNPAQQQGQPKGQGAVAERHHHRLRPGNPQGNQGQR